MRILHHWRTFRLTARSHLFAALFATLGCTALPAMAWNATGHRLVAGLAWEVMTPSARAEAGRLLRAHPDTDRWQKRAPEDNFDRHLFLAASTWPDEIRKDKRFYTADEEEPTPLLPGFPHMRRHSEWHYEARPLEAVRWSAPNLPKRIGQVGEGLAQTAQVLGNRKANDVERHYALPWLIHLAGDSHQPLHLSLRLDASGRWDKLGSNVLVNVPTVQKSKTTLHAFWDDLGGPSGLRGGSFDTEIQQLMARYPVEKMNTNVSFEQWLDQSWRLARQFGYPENPDDSPTLSEAFRTQSQEVARKRIAEAGYRLGILLNQLFGR